ncbi:MAG: hypothetical protein AB7F99_13175, partial [Vicinamibacterales bacterium]
WAPRPDQTPNLRSHRAPEQQDIRHVMREHALDLVAQLPHAGEHARRRSFESGNHEQLSLRDTDSDIAFVQRERDDLSSE